MSWSIGDVAVCKNRSPKWPHGDQVFERKLYRVIGVHAGKSIDGSCGQSLVLRGVNSYPFRGYMAWRFEKLLKSEMPSCVKVLEHV